MPLFSLVDAAMVSADFCPPLLEHPETHDVAGFLHGLSTTRMLYTRGLESVEWAWDGKQGTTAVDEVEALFTLGAGDVLHGAFIRVPGILYGEEREVLEDSSGLIASIARIIGVSTSVLGTRPWRDDPRVAEAAEEFLSFSEVKDSGRGPVPK